MTLEEILKILDDLDQRTRGVGPHTVEMVLDLKTASEIWVLLRELKSRRDDEMEKKDKKKQYEQKYEYQQWRTYDNEWAKAKAHAEQSRKHYEEKMRKDQEQAFYSGLGAQKGRPYEGPYDNRAPPPGWDFSNKAGPQMTQEEIDELIRKMYDSYKASASNPFGNFWKGDFKREDFDWQKKPPPSTNKRRPWYEVLGVNPAKCDRATIKSAWRKLAKQHHPDRAGGNAKLMAEINQAKDEGLRRYA